MTKPNLGDLRHFSHPSSIPSSHISYEAPTSPSSAVLPRSNGILKFRKLRKSQNVQVLFSLLRVTVKRLGACAECNHTYLTCLYGILTTFSCLYAFCTYLFVHSTRTYKQLSCVQLYGYFRVAAIFCRPATVISLAFACLTHAMFLIIFAQFFHNYSFCVSSISLFPRSF